MTGKQFRVAKSGVRGSLVDMRITLESSIGILEDWRKDLKSELQELSKTIRKANKNLKALVLEIEKPGE